jgi:anti-anti-sigma regulatory factor
LIEPAAGEEVMAVQMGSDSGSLVVELSGTVRGAHLPSLRRIVASARRERRGVTIDCRQVVRVDRRAVGFLAASRARGVQITRVPAYVNYWLDEAAIA